MQPMDVWIVSTFLSIINRGEVMPKCKCCDKTACVMLTSYKTGGQYNFCYEHLAKFAHATNEFESNHWYV